MKTRSLLLCAGLFMFSTLVQAVGFTFSITSPSSTSAGVYTSDGTLVRTLWSGIKYDAGTFIASWDGKNDDGIILPYGDYTIKVLSNNVKYEWEGVVGNTSSSFTGSRVHQGLNKIYGMSIANNNAYFCKNQSEGNPSHAKFVLTNPQEKLNVLNERAITQATTFTCTDGQYVYWGGGDAFGNPNISFVYATQTSNDAEVPFQYGQTYTVGYGRTYSAIDVFNYPGGFISGMAVQKNGNFLFVAHHIGVIRVLNKRTGAEVKTISIKEPSGLSVDASGNLWVCYTANNRAAVQRFSVGSDGSITPISASLPGIEKPIAVAVSPDNATVAIVDIGYCQQVKFYTNSNTPQQTGVLGEAGGYSNGPEVKDNKFYFSDEIRFSGVFVSYQPDGSFWVNDPGNCRVQHFNKNASFKETLMYLPNSYNTNIDGNNPTRVFCEFLEFKIDYSKPLGAENGSWKLVRNWTRAVPAEYDGFLRGLYGVNTLSNGRTYALVRHRDRHDLRLVELPQNANLRFTNIDIESTGLLYPDGSVRVLNYGNTNYGYTVRTLSGFTGNNNPVWSSTKDLAKLNSLAESDPFHISTYRTNPGEITSSGVVVAFDANASKDGSVKYHLGGIKTGTNKWLWRAALGTGRNYTDSFPGAGQFDDGNGVNYAGSVALAIEKSIFWGYNGEFWKGSQTNKFNHVYENGLFVAQFGVTGPETHEDAPAKMAGNVLNPVVTKVGDDYYLYHNDENAHSGIHRWKISGLNSIKVDSVSIRLTIDAKDLYVQHPAESGETTFRNVLTAQDANLAALPLTTSENGYVMVQPGNTKQAKHPAAASSRSLQ